MLNTNAWRHLMLCKQMINIKLEYLKSFSGVQINEL